MTTRVIKIFAAIVAAFMSSFTAIKIAAAQVENGNKSEDPSEEFIGLPNWESPASAPEAEVAAADISFAEEEEEVFEEEEDIIPLPKKLSSHRSSSREEGFWGTWRWGKVDRSHHTKGLTLSDYRKGNHLRKKCIHHN